MDVIRFFDAAHSALHAGDVYDGRTPNIDRWLGGLSEDQLRVRPAGLNSIIWLLWHMARTEDAAVKDRLLRFQARYTNVAKPFQWTFTRRHLAALLAKLARRPRRAAA